MEYLSKECQAQMHCESWTAGWMFRTTHCNKKTAKEEDTGQQYQGGQSQVSNSMPQEKKRDHHDKIKFKADRTADLAYTKCQKQLTGIM